MAPDGDRPNEPGWSPRALQARIVDAPNRVRHAAGSPDASEIAACGFGFRGHAWEGRDWYRYYPVYAPRRLSDRGGE